MPASRKNDDIQVLRAFAITMVVVGHLRLIHAFIPEAFTHGVVGVFLFFVVSGFVITLSSMRMPQENFTLAFLTKRLFRIVPVAGIWLAAYAAFYGTTYALSIGPDVMPQVWSIMTFQYNYHIADTGTQLGHYWSLMVEEHFYLAFAFLFPLLKWRRLVVPAMLLVAVVTEVYLRPYAGRQGYTEACLDFFALGVIIAYAGNAASVRLPRWLLIATSTILLLSVWVSFALPVPKTYDLLLIMSAGLVFIASADRNVIAPVPYLRQVLVWIGERSYSLYLVHPLVIPIDSYVATYVRAYMAIGLVPRAVIVVAVSLVVGHLSHKWLEQPFDRLGKRIAARLMPTPVTAGALSSA